MVPDAKRLHGWTDFRGNTDLLVPSGAETRCGLSLMDQERDTIGNDKSSHRKRLWRDNSTPNPSSGRETDKIRPFDKNASKGFQKIHAADPPADSEPLPVLFELPDRTPEDDRKRLQTPQFTLHNAHVGPPAGHVDPPSGNHSHLVHTGPTSPMGSDSIHPDAQLMDVQDELRLGDAPIDQAIPETDQKTAAYRDESISWSDQVKASWVARSAVVFLVLAMVTLAFFSGRGLRPGTPQSGESFLTKTKSSSKSVEDSVVVMIDDIEMLEDLSSPVGAEAADASAVSSTPAPSLQNSSNVAGQEILDAIANLPQDESGFPAIPAGDFLQEVDQPPAGADLPSYIADLNHQPKTGSLGTPSASTPNDDVASHQTFPSDEFNSDPSRVPSITSATESVVAFRKPDQNGIINSALSNDLPSGMDDRLKLEDGLRYSETPYPIGNFLEIQQSLDASQLQR